MFYIVCNSKFDWLGDRDHTAGGFSLIQHCHLLATLLKHLPPRLRQLQRQEAADRQRARGEQDGHGFGDAHKGLEDADPQHSGELAQGVQESEGRSPVENTDSGVS